MFFFLHSSFSFGTQPDSASLLTGITSTAVFLTGLANAKHSDGGTVCEVSSPSDEDIELTMSDICEPYARWVLRSPRVPTTAAWLRKKPWVSWVCLLCDCYRPGFAFGAKMPARAIRTPKDSNHGSLSVTRNMKTRENYNVFLYFGIIDVLKNYGMSKRIEHVYKSLQYDSKSISAINPKAYSSRFQEFLSMVFQEDESSHNPTTCLTAVNMTLWIISIKSTP